MKDLLKIFAFIKRDLSVLKGYRFSFVLNLVSIVMGIAMYYFLAKLFGEKGLNILKEFGGNYFPYVLVGISLANFLMTALHTFSSSMMGERSSGALESIVATPTREYLLFLGLSLWNFLFSSLMVFLYITVGVVIFKFKLTSMNPVSSMIVLFVSTVVFSSLGILSASFLLVFRRGNPITWLFSSVSMLVGGVYFPVEILPDWLKFVSKLVPLTYSLQALRKTIIQGYDIYALYEEVLFLTIFAAVLFPVSLLSFKLALNWVKKNGSLIHY